MVDSAGHLAALILAAGKGTRLKSRLPKVLHSVCGDPLLAFALTAAESLAPERSLVVIGHEAESVRARFAGRAEFITQAEQRGTGHAVQQCQQPLEGFQGDVLILYGDTPLLRGETLARLVRHKRETGADLVLLSADVEVPGIVMRDRAGRVARIVEATDATAEELAIRERNTGVYVIRAGLLWKLLAQVGAHNAQGEIYLTDIVELAVRERCQVDALRMEDASEALGVNTRAELAEAERVMRARILARLMDAGVTVVDPAATYVDARVEVGADTRIEPGCVIQGATRIGRGVHLKAHCTIESSTVGDDVEMGPCAHLRPGCEIGRGCRIGNFVEVKNSVLGAGVKADHLSYIGDADVGERASFGCGAVVVNYDGVAKHRTVVGARAFIGCNVNLIAPLEVEPDSYVAAGSTITTAVPREALAVARARQRNIEGWVTRRGRKRD
ncbi:MAG: bifunctional UDP-N-acetylglucosamine diphosphorylase/glucosamine-1-phosphate N-acetyltransferase GlmU [Myxococcales bacterium]|nr:bifunctional UDP-N-acetylglucosamine diphosphorylase/glucosamine-1-phosphate N-acetyltransferase GlmU [Myxococcales bacterium]MDH5306269.1 bifunctional UDP-N-acetylglucosamine diphosphorylase/glucosamine-1-phosphate N-acetyltransferase GlmU [Myxococcales bacterium]